MHKTGFYGFGHIVKERNGCVVKRDNDAELRCAVEDDFSLLLQSADSRLMFREPFGVFRVELRMGKEEVGLLKKHA